MRIFYILLIYLPVYSIAQHQQVQSIVQNTACTCFESLVIEKEQDYEQLYHLGDSCVERALLPHLTAMMKIYETNLNDDVGMLRMAENFTKKTQAQCKAYRDYLKVLAEREVEEHYPVYKEHKGLLVHLEVSGKFPVFTLLLEDGTWDEFYWLSEFDGSARFFKGLKPYANTVFIVSWLEREFYDQELNNYRNFKEIKLIEEVGTVDAAERKKKFKLWEKAWKKAMKKKKK